ncbi:MAG TPA: hypothetical protein DCW31_10095 [Lactobacillus sp.]|nr:hypothetical protein [Lactobacillus sp.]
MMSAKAKWGRWFWGIFFLVSAGLLLAIKMGWLTYHLSAWTIVATIVLAAFAIKSVAYFSVGGLIFSLAFMSMLYAKPLGITGLVPWTILGVALLLSIGLGLILRPLRHRFYRRHAYFMADRWAQHHGTTFQRTTTTATDRESAVNVNVRLGNAVRYIQSEDFQQANINVSMGEAKIYFDKAHIVGDQANIFLNGNMGEVDLYIPRDWNVDVEIDAPMIDVNEKGVKPTKTGPNVLITGAFKLGEIDIIYIDVPEKAEND